MEHVQEKMDVCDKTVIYGMLKKVSKTYNLDYDEVIELCGLSSIGKQKDNSDQLEHICIDNIDYLYDFKNNIVYKQKKQQIMKFGILCPTTQKVIKFRTT